MQSVSTVGTIDKINDILGTYCADGYGAGSTGAANIKWLEQQGFEFIRIERVYRLGELARFDGPVTNSARFGEFLEALKGLESYPLFDDETLSEMQQEWTDEEWKNILEENNLDPVVFWATVFDGEYYWEDDGHADLYGMHASFDIEEFVAAVKAGAQTWGAHYNSGEYHQPEVCEYCKEAEEAENV